MLLKCIHSSSLAGHCRHSAVIFTLHPLNLSVGNIVSAEVNHCWQGILCRKLGKFCVLYYSLHSSDSLPKNIVDLRCNRHKCVRDWYLEIGDWYNQIHVTFVGYINLKCETAFRSLFQCSRAFGGNWGTLPTVTTWIYSLRVYCKGYAFSLLCISLVAESTSEKH